MTVKNQEVILWRRKGSELFCPADEEYETELENGDTDDKTQALGAKGSDIKEIIEHYEKLDKILEENGVKNRFTIWLLKDYEPVIVEMTESELKAWEKIFDGY